MRLGLQWRWFAGLAVLFAILLAVVYLAIEQLLPPYLLERIRSLFN